MRIRFTRTFQEDPTFTIVVGIWLLFSIAIYNSQILSGFILDLSKELAGQSTENYVILLKEANMTPSHIAVWIYYVVSTLPMAILFFICGGFCTYKNLKRGALTLFLLCGLGLLAAWYMFSGIILMERSSHTYWTDIFYRSPFGCAAAFGASSLIFSYSAGYLIWKIFNFLRSAHKQSDV